MNQPHNPLQVIENTIKAPATMNRLAMALGYSATDTAGKEKARSYAASVLAEIEKSRGDSKKDLTVCNPMSIAQTMIDAASFKIKIDGRQHAHLVKYGNNVTLQIGYRGYLAKIKEHYPDADFVVEPIYEGDDLHIWHENDTQHYTLKKASVFNDGPEKLKGVLFAVTYTDAGRLVRKVNAVPKSRIERAKKAAKQDFIWGTDYIEKAKAAAIKASCKIHFASLSGLSDVIQFDNTHNFDQAKEEAAPEPSKGPSIIDNLNSQIVEPQIIEAEIVEENAPSQSVEKQEPAQPCSTPPGPAPSTTAQAGFPGCGFCHGSGVELVKDINGEREEPCLSCFPPAPAAETQAEGTAL